MLSERQQLLADTAIAVIARDGSRGLTHRAVDTAAGLPPGSTSYYYRTRAALLAACVHRLSHLDLADAATVPAPADEVDQDTIVDALVALVERWLTTDRERRLARTELSLEAARRPDLAEDLRAAADRLRGDVRTLVASAGTSDPDRRARWLVACIDGLVLDRLVSGAPVDGAALAHLRAGIRDLVASVVPQASRSGDAQDDPPRPQTCP